MAFLIGIGGSTDPNRLDLMTKRRVPIPNTRRKPRIPSQMQAAVEFVLNGHPDRSLRSKASEYNCMGLAFANRRTCIDIQDIDWILRDDEYRTILASAVQPGDLLVYRDKNGPSHVAVVLTHHADVEHATWRTRVLSQWGADGEYFHDPDDVHDVLGTPHKFWTDRT